jgi:drug/metabolite transporter (DMT)-like permease
VALALVYLSWGTTYLAIREGVKYFPPALFGGTRVGLAGLILLGFLTLRGAPVRLPVGRLLWLAVAGVILFVGGNGLITFAEKTIESGAASLLAATTPVWMALLETVRPHGERLTWRGWLGLFTGLLGLMLLVPLPHNLADVVKDVGPLLVLGSAMSWALGSCLLRLRPTQGSPFAEAGYQMVFGGAAMTIFGLCTGEAAQISSASFTTVSIWAFVHLLVFGSLVGFVAFTWLMNHTSAALAGTYAYVNPMVAVLLGWWIAHERLTPWTLAGMVVILASVALVRSGLARPPRPSAARRRKRLPEPCTSA